MCYLWSCLEKNIMSEEKTVKFELEFSYNFFIIIISFIIGLVLGVIIK